MDTIVLIDNINYSIPDLTGNEASVIPLDTGKYTGNINIPSSITYNSKNYTVTTIAEAFNSCPEVTVVNLPSTITTITKNSFNGCIGLTYIKIPFNVNYIGENAFAGTTNLQDFICLSDNWMYDFYNIGFLNKSIISSIPKNIYVTPKLYNPYREAGVNVIMAETACRPLPIGEGSTIIYNTYPDIYNKGLFFNTTTQELYLFGRNLGTVHQ